MKRLAVAIVLLGAALGFPGAALADVTARYTLGKEVLTVEVDDSGNARMGIDGKFSLITRDGVDYLVVTMQDQAMVLRYDETLALAKVEMKLPTLPKGGEAKVFVLSEGGPAEVAGRKGQSWTFGLKDAPPTANAVEAVMSEDPELAPVGSLIRRLLGPVIPVVQGMFPPSSEFSPTLLALLTKGTPLRIATFVELASVDRKEIDSHRFDLPGPVMPAADFKALMESSRSGVGEIPPLP